MDFGHIADIVLVFTMVPSMVAADDLDMLQFGIAFVGVAHKQQAVVFEVGEGINDRFGFTMVGRFPIIDDGIGTETKIAKVLRGTAITYHGVGSAVNIKHSHRRHRRVVSHGMGNQSADGRASRDAITVFDGHAMRHETAHGEACEEDTVEV